MPSPQSRPIHDDLGRADHALNVRDYCPKSVFPKTIARPRSVRRRERRAKLGAFRLNTRHRDVRREDVLTRVFKLSNLNATYFGAFRRELREKYARDSGTHGVSKDAIRLCLARVPFHSVECVVACFARILSGLLRNVLGTPGDIRGV